MQTVSELRLCSTKEILMISSYFSFVWHLQCFLQGFSNSVNSVSKFNQYLDLENQELKVSLQQIFFERDAQLTNQFRFSVILLLPWCLDAEYTSFAECNLIGGFLTSTGQSLSNSTSRK